MTRFYKQAGFTLARANPSTRVLISLFLISVLAGCFDAILQYSQRAGGFSDHNAREWIVGNETDIDAEELIPAKSSRELLSLVHDHIFSLAILLFVVLHLVELTPWNDGPKIVLSLLGYGSLVFMLASPWWIRDGGTVAPLLMRVAGSGMILVLTCGSLACLDELWWAPRRRRRLGKSEPEAPSPLFPGAGKRSSGCPLGHDTEQAEENGDS